MTNALVAARDHDDADDNAAHLIKHVSFTLGEETYAINAARVNEVLPSLADEMPLHRLVLTGPPLHRPFHHDPVFAPVVRHPPVSGLKAFKCGSIHQFLPPYTQGGMHPGMGTLTPPPPPPPSFRGGGRRAFFRRLGSKHTLESEPKHDRTQAACRAV